MVKKTKQQAKDEGEGTEATETEAEPKSAEQIGQERAAESIKSLQRTARLLSEMDPKQLAGWKRLLMGAVVNGMLASIEAIPDAEKKLVEYKELFELLNGPKPKE